MRETGRLIIGSGPQGIILAARLDAAGHKDFIIVDPFERPAYLLGERFRDCGTVHLRSGCGEHCDDLAESLRMFCESTGRGDELRTDRKRPTVELFMAHTELVWNRHALGEHLLRAWVADIRRAQDGSFIVVTNRGKIRAKEVYLCIGQPTPAYPLWATTTRGHNPRVSHIFDNDYELTQLPEGEQFVVVGGGITAAQVASSLVLQAGRRVTLVTRRPLTGGAGRTNTVDWLDPDRRRQLCALPWGKRAAYLKDEGDSGTVPWWELEVLDRLKNEAKIIHRITEVAHLAPTNAHVCLIDRDGDEIHGDAVVLATGLETGIPPWLKMSASALGLPFDERGFPLLTDQLEWGKGLFVHGHFAKLVVGPFAANIVGGMIAANIQLERLEAA